MTLTSEERGEICGIFAGDGNLDKRKPFVRIYIAIDEKEYAQHVSEILSKVINRPVKIRKDVKNVFIVYVFSERLVNLIKNYLTWGNNKSRTIKLETLKHNSPFIKGFLRGLLDTDGCTRQGSVEFNTVSKHLIEQISYFLELLKIKFKVFSWTYKWNNENRIAYKIFLRTLESKKLVELIEPKNSKRCKLSDTLIDHHEEEKILELRRNGLNVYDIAKEIERSHASVSKILLKHNLSKKRTTKKEATEILKLWKKGYSRKDIAKIANKSNKVVYWTITKRTNLLE